MSWRGKLEKKTEKEMEKSIWSRKIFVCMGEEKQKMKKRKIFGKRNFCF